MHPLKNKISTFFYSYKSVNYNFFAHDAHDAHHANDIKKTLW